MKGGTKRPVGSRFNPNDLKLVRLYLRNMVKKNESSFITVLDIYKDEPWLLNHVQNVLFKKNEWYYFVPRTPTGPKRTVPGRGGSEGGWWKSTGTKIDIRDRKNNLIGYKRSLVYHKNVKGKRYGDKTDWLMTEYTLNYKGKQFQPWVLCWIRDETEKRGKHPILHHVPPQVENNMDNVILPNQVQEEEEEEEEVDFTDFANQIERMMLYKEHGDLSQQQEDTSILLPTNDNNFMMMSNQEPYQSSNFGFDGVEDVMLDVNEFLRMTDDITQQQQHQEVPLQLQQHQDSGFEAMQSNDNNFIMMSTQELYQRSDFGFDGAEDVMLDVDELLRMKDDITQQQQQQEVPLQLQQYQDS